MDERPICSIHLFHHVSSKPSVSASTTTTDSTNDADQAAAYESKFANVAQQLTSTGYTNPIPLLNNLVVESAVVSNQHLAFLLDDGRVCRIKYQVVQTASSSSGNNVSSGGGGSSSQTTSGGDQSSQATSTSTTNASSSSSSRSKHSRTATSAAAVSAAAAAVSVAVNMMGGNGGSGGGGSTSGGGSGGSSSASGSSSFRGQASSSSSRSLGTSGGASSSSGSMRTGEAFIMPTPHDILSSSQSFGVRGGRRNQLLRGRVSSLIVGAPRIPSFVPASAVPESLIENVQAVLQSKSRNVIIRELQRTVRLNRYLQNTFASFK